MLLRTAIHPTAVAKKYHSLKKRRIAQNWISYTILLGVLLLLATLAELAELSTKLFMKCTFYRFWFYSLKRRFFRRKKIFFFFCFNCHDFIKIEYFSVERMLLSCTHCSGQTNFLFIFTVLEIQTHKYVPPHIVSIWEKVEECYHMSFSDRCCSITIHFDFYVTSKGQRSPINVCYVGICLKSCNFQDFWQDFHHIQL